MKTASKVSQISQGHECWIDWQINDMDRLTMMIDLNKNKNNYQKVIKFHKSFRSLIQLVRLQSSDMN